jgi:hypothetical protein
VAYGCSIAAVAPFVYHVSRGAAGFLGLFEDDYFYYALIADKLVATGKLTYDGITTTNGFHPLWFVVVTVLRWTFGRFTPAFYLAFSAVALAAMLATYELGVRLGRRLGAAPVVAAVVPALFSLSAGRLLTSGLECVLAIPLYLWLLLEATAPDPLTARRATWLGFISSLVILARLDLALAVALLIPIVAWASGTPRAQMIRRALAFCAGGVLVPLYVFLNVYLVGSPLPVSALAKRLTTTPGFSLAYVRVAALDSVYGAAMAVVLPVGSVALLMLVRKRRADLRAGWLAAASAVVFAALFFLLNALSSWVFFGWYAYPFHAAALVCSLAIASLLWASRNGKRVVAAVACALCVIEVFSAADYFVARGPRWSVRDNGLLAMSLELAEVMRPREGRIAMGAVAGIATYVMDRPVLQIEGIVADLRMVRHVQAGDALGAVLAEYGADYLVVTLAGGIPMEKQDDCFVITQPHAQWAGKRTPKMRGQLCTPPIARFETVGNSNPWSSFTRMETWVWDLRGATWREP